MTSNLPKSVLSLSGKQQEPWLLTKERGFLYIAQPRYHTWYHVGAFKSHDVPIRPNETRSRGMVVGGVGPARMPPKLRRSQRCTPRTAAKATHSNRSCCGGSFIDTARAAEIFHRKNTLLADGTRDLIR